MIRFLLDTHIVIHWLSTSAKLSRDQSRVIRQAVQSGDRLGVSTITLLEIASKFGGGRRTDALATEALRAIESSPVFLIISYTVEMAQETSRLLPLLRDPMDAAIVATARIEGLRLVTSDTRILESKLVSVI